MDSKKRNEINYPKLKTLGFGDLPTPTNALLNLLRRDPTEPNHSAAIPKIDVSRLNLDKISRTVSQDHFDNDAIMQLLPDLELVETVYVGSIIDPKSLSDGHLTYSVDQSIFDSELSRLLIEPIEKYFNKDYKINDRLDLILSDILFRKGAYIIGVFPENVLDKMINGHRSLSMEEFAQLERSSKVLGDAMIGFLGEPDIDVINKVELKNGKTLTLGLEDFSGEYRSKLKKNVYGDPNVTVTDNFNLLKLPSVHKQARSLKINSLISKNRASVESTVHAFDNTEINKLYQTSVTGSENTQIVNSPAFSDRPSVGHPLSLHLPMESVIPVFEHGRPHEHIGYFILTDQNGYPVSSDTTRDFYSEMQTNFKSSNAGGENTSEILRLTREAMGGQSNQNEFTIDSIQKTYAAIMTNELHNRLRNGMYTQELDISLTKEIQRVMLYRSWKAKHTQLIFVPVELITYMAFDYDHNGIGETLISRSKIIATMRSTLLTADVIGGMRNAVGRKRVRITLDPDDTDPEQTVNNIQSNLMESAFRSFPLAAPDPAQAQDHLLRSGFDFEINTNGAGYGETKVEFDDYNTNVNAGNPELQDRLRRMHISGMGIPPEKVDPMSTPDFAVSVVQNDLVLSRRVKEKQKALCSHITKFIKVFTNNSSILMNELIRIVSANGSMLVGAELRDLTPVEVVEEFIAALEVSLPAPDDTQYERQIETLEKYERLLTTALESYITSDLFPDEYLKIPGLADKTITQIKAYFLRQFMSRNNILPELNVLMEMDGDKPSFNILDWLATQQESLGAAILNYAKVLANKEKRLVNEHGETQDAADDTEMEDNDDDAFDTSSKETDESSEEDIDGDDDFGSIPDIGDDDFDDLGDPMGDPIEE